MWKKQKLRYLKFGKICLTVEKLSSRKRICDRCKNQVNDDKEIEANLSLFKGQATDWFGHMIAHYKEVSFRYLFLRMIPCKSQFFHFNWIDFSFRENLANIWVL